jgi:hypothetical protein
MKNLQAACRAGMTTLRAGKGSFGYQKSHRKVAFSRWQEPSQTANGILLKLI